MKLRIIRKAPPFYAKAAKELITRETTFDNTWGNDHGTWSVLVHIIRKGRPVFQVNIDANATPEEHYKIGRELRTLREQEYL